MASSTKIAIIALDSTGAPLGSLAPTWASFRDLADGAARTPQPTIAECGAGTGLYSFAHGLSAGQAVDGDLHRLASGERWAIWRRQIASGREPCFATPERFGCAELRCPWRNRCLALRAEWLR